MFNGRPTAKRQNAKIAGLTLHLRGNSAAIAARARKGLEARFVRDALALDPTLSGDKLAAKVRIVRKLFYLRIARRSAEIRARRASRARTQDVSDAGGRG